jgi:hypothetical protein
LVVDVATLRAARAPGNGLISQLRAVRMCAFDKGFAVRARIAAPLNS